MFHPRKIKTPRNAYVNAEGLDLRLGIHVSSVYCPLSCVPALVFSILLSRYISILQGTMYTYVYIVHVCTVSTYVVVSCMCICEWVHSWKVYIHVHVYLYILLHRFTVRRSAECPANGGHLGRRGPELPHTLHEPVPLPGRGGA